VIPLDEVDCLAGEALPIRDDLFRTAKAEVSQEIENIIWLDAGIHSLNERFVHFLCSGKRALAVPDDVEVPEVEIGCEPYIPHTVIFTPVAVQGACEARRSSTASMNNFIQDRPE
jgi:hypothetical protein